MSAKKAEPEIVNRSVPVDGCQPHPENYNQHDDDQIQDLRASLRTFGQVQSIVVQEAGEDNFIILAGEGVWTAAKLEGLEELRADVVPASWSDAKALAYLGADNELARRSHPDEAQLAALVMRVEAEADAELAKLAAGGELELALVKAQSELAAALKEQLGQEAGSGAWDNVGQGGENLVIRAVIAIPEVSTFEQALGRTGKPHRGDAMMEICQFYLEEHGGIPEAG